MKNNYNRIIWKSVYQAFMMLFYLFIFSPVILLVIFSFNLGKYPTLPWRGFTLVWYEQLFTNTSILDPVVNSIISASIVAFLSIVIGIIGANYFYRLKHKYKDTLFVFSFAPALLPALLLGIAFVSYLKLLTINPSLVTVILFQTVFFSPIAVALIYYGVSKVDKNVESACYDLGGNTFIYFFKVLLPILKWNLAGVFLLIFTFSWDEFIISWFVSGFAQTVPIKVWTMLKTAISPEINALGTIILLITISILFISMLLINKKIGKK